MFVSYWGREGGGVHMKFEKLVPYYYKCFPSNLVKDGPRSFSQEKKIVKRRHLSTDIEQYPIPQ